MRFRDNDILRIRQQATASENARVYQAGRDQVNVTRSYHFHVNTERRAGETAASLEPPFKLLPRRLHGREAELTRLTDLPAESVTVLHGMGGVGKTALALSAARTQKRKGSRVFWIPAADRVGVREALLQVAIRAGATESAVQEAAVGNISAADLAWEALSGSGGSWLVVFDSADDPMAVEDELGSEWLRAAPGGCVLVTTRVGGRDVWSEEAHMVRLAPLSRAAGRDMLIDTADLPAVDEEQREHAAQLADRLGGVPLALRLAGRCLALPASTINGFDGYLAALDRDFPDAIDRAAATAGVGGTHLDERRLVMQTWEISLDFLEQQGIPQTRTLMRLLSCFASRPLPIAALRTKVLARTCADAGPWDNVTLQRSLNALSDLGLLDITTEGPDEYLHGDFYRVPDHTGAGHKCVSVHPLVAEVNAAQLGVSPTRTDVWMAAVRCMGSFRGAWPEDPRDSSFWQLLVPHVVAASTRLPEDPGPLLKEVVEITAWFGEYLRTSGQYEVAHGIAEAVYARARLLPDDARERFHACYVFADWAWRTSRLEPAEALSVEARRLAGLQHDADSFHVLAADYLLAAVVLERGEFATAEHLHRDIMGRLAGGWPRNHALWVQAHHQLATALRERGFLEEAEHESRTAVTLCEETPGFPRYTESVVRHELGVILWHRGKLDEALGIFHDVMRRQRAFLPSWHPSVLITRFSVASIHRIRGHQVRALLDFKELSLIESDILGEHHYSTLQSKHNVAQILVQRGKLDEAEALLKEIMASREENGLGSRHEDVLATRHELTHILSQRGRHVTALREWKQILDEERAHLGPNHPSTLRTHFNWAVGWAQTGQLAVARCEMRRVLRARRHTLGNAHHETQEARRALAQLSTLPGTPRW
ncbi:tetratricopeptide repeat protein [Streptomyces bambusae]|uniref:Tetratricopeptide repeat protein n=1 Tax=Streptomyces bambusae TaxID=1550616 RepID=A0ABS6Z8P1_9ACTN|nr:tetratricopeptide repeat protein [Streptomyces bambusae]MBW5484129.1 tetratricopeptide repeat protein [Streptomyces bambusae]